MHVREREKRGLQFLGFEFGHDWREREGELICTVISLVPSSKLSLLPAKKKKEKKISR